MRLLISDKGNHMTESSGTVKIDYYTDVLCIWAWIAQLRVNALGKEFGSRIDIIYRCVNVFGDALNKLDQLWQSRGGREAYAAHVHEVAGLFDLTVHPDIWKEISPCSSLNAHLVIQAVALTSPAHLSRTLFAIREAFFVSAKDISDFDTLIEIVSGVGVAAEDVRRHLGSGGAAALVMADYQQAETLKLRGSPSFVLNEGRQILFGNVGYRVLHANIEELLNKPAAEASWC